MRLDLRSRTLRLRCFKFICGLGRLLLVLRDIFRSFLLCSLASDEVEVAMCGIVSVFKPELDRMKPTLLLAALSSSYKIYSCRCRSRTGILNVVSLRREIHRVNTY